MCFNRSIYVAIGDGAASAKGKTMTLKKTIFVVGFAWFFCLVHPAAAETLGNQETGLAPCIILQNYQIEQMQDGGDRSVHHAYANVENVCARSVDLHFCFQRFEEEGDSVESECYSGPVRPWSAARVESTKSPTRIMGPSYGWTFLD